LIAGDKILNTLCHPLVAAGVFLSRSARQ
jgi:hypothetical protein